LAKLLWCSRRLAAAFLAVAGAGVAIVGDFGGGGGGAWASGADSLADGGAGGAAGSWVAIGPDGGQATLLAYAPSSAQTAYAVLGPGGVFVTNDGAAHWSAAGDGLDGLEILSLAVDPRNPWVAYAGTAGGGVYRTSNGGAQWTAARRGLGNREVRALAADGAEPGRLYAGTGGGLYLSRDGAQHWQPLAGLPAGAAVDTLQASGDALIAAAGGAVWRSLDRGLTWTEKSRGLGAELFQHPAQLAANPGFGAWYAASTGGAWKSADRGETWTPLLAAGVTALAVTAAGDLYVAAGEVLARSRDGGVTFRVLPRFGPGRITSLASPPGSETVMAGTDGRGFFRTDDGAETWQEANLGLRAGRVTSLAVAAAGGGATRIYAALRTAAPEVERSDDGGLTWTVTAQQPLAGDEPAGPVGLLGVHPAMPDQLYAGLRGGIARSPTGGTTWEPPPPAGQPGGCIEPRALAIAPSAPPVLYLAAARAGIDCLTGCAGARSLDGGDTWTCMRRLDAARAVAVDAAEPGTLYAAAGEAPGPRLWKSLDFGATWTPADAGLQGAAVLAVALQPDSRQTLLALTATGAVFRTADGAAIWHPVGDLGATVRAGATLLADPRGGATWYAALPGAGVLRTGDGGVTWAPLGNGLPAALASGPLALDPLRPILYAATDGRGLFKLALPPAP
jgi:photosystem II stability/assembly factor-like uncharacterized protein